MKLVLLVVIGLVIAAGLTLYFQPNLLGPGVLSQLPLPNLLVFSPRSGQKVDLKFTVSGYSKSPPQPLQIINSQSVELFSSVINDSKFSIPVDLTAKAIPGDQIDLIVGNPSSPLTISLTLR